MIIHLLSDPVPGYIITAVRKQQSDISPDHPEGKDPESAAGNCLYCTVRQKLRLILH